MENVNIEKQFTERIMPEEIVKAFQETGFKAKRYSYFDTENEMCACGLGIFYYKNMTENADNHQPITEKLDDLFGGHYRLGFAYGFDGNETEELEKYMENERFSTGYQDGKDSWKASVETGLAYF